MRLVTLLAGLPGQVQVQHHYTMFDSPRVNGLDDRQTEKDELLF
jgi:hypothetical protein